MRLSRPAKLIMGNLLALLILFAAAEAGLRVLFARMRPGYECYRRTYPGEHENGVYRGRTAKVEWLRADPVLGWVCRRERHLVLANTNLNALGIAYEINPQGFRDAADFDALPLKGDTRRAMVLGDSFVFGVYQPEEALFTTLLEQRRPGDWDFFNVAIPGWGVDQMVLAYEEYQAAIQPDIVLLFYIDDDVARTAEAFRKTELMNKPSFDLDGADLVPRRPPACRLLRWAGEHSYLLNTGYKRYWMRYSTRLADALFRRLAEETASRGQRLVLVRIPYAENLLGKKAQDQFDYAHVAQSPHVSFIPLLDRMSALMPGERKALYLENDGHFSARGHALVADVLAAEVFGKAGGTP